MKTCGKSKIRGLGPNSKEFFLCPRISDKETSSRVQEAIEKANRKTPHPSSLDTRGWKRGRAALVRSLPAWIERFGLLAGPNEYGLWCEPFSSPGDTFPNQMVMDVPPGRYMIEILDTATSSWISQESAEGGPLIAGLPYTGNPVLVWVRFRN